MANTYTQLFVHYVFAVQDRLSLLRLEIQDDIYSYMAGIVKENGHGPQPHLMRCSNRS